MAQQTIIEVKHIQNIEDGQIIENEIKVHIERDYTGIGSLSSDMFHLRVDEAEQLVEKLKVKLAQIQTGI